MQFDGTGKASFDHIYTQPDPRPYFRTLQALDYCIPQLAKPYFAGLIEEYRRALPAVGPVTVLDIGCSYGVNAALLRCDVSMAELYGRYCDEPTGEHSRAALVARDRQLAATRRSATPARFVGLDTAGPALAYALDAGFLDDAVHADLERREPTDEQRRRLAGTDLIISTGCFGYITGKTIARVLTTAGDRRPWMAHFVLRMFSFAPVADELAELGYETVALQRPFRQRRFASAEERSAVLDAVSATGADTRGLEAGGWLYAQLHLSRPRGRKVWTVADPAPGDGENRSVTAPVRTFDNEDALPRAPLPTLEASCELFLDWSAPLLTAEQRARTEAAVAEFLAPGSPARTLQAALAGYDATPGVRSWLDTFWPYRYLGRRDRIALNANFFFLFRDTGEGQLDRAAGLVAAALNYKVQLDREVIAPVVQRGQPQSMEQHKYLFGTTRIPGAIQDTVRAPYTAAEPGPARARHIVVFVRGNMFRLDVIAPDGRPHSLDDLVAGLRAVRAAGARAATTGTSVGHLTTKARAEWAASREALLAHAPANAAVLDTVETALFCLCLEDTAPADQLAASDLLLHGDSGNRWFDKAVSLIVFADGRAGINVEHCTLDGTTILSFVDALLGTPAAEQSIRSNAVQAGTPAVAPITFALDEELRADVQAAAAAFAVYSAATATTVVSFADFGSTRAKQLRVSPDAFVQCAYQLAHRRAKGRLGATYESIATRHWQHGRTEAMRVVTPELQRFVAAMDDPAADAAGRRAALTAAAERHAARAKQCQAGQAPEQHLWELQLIQRRRGAELGVTDPLALYDSPGWTVMREDYLSTSSAPSTNITYFGFGSTSQRCIGVGYVLLPDRLNVYLSTPRPVAAAMHVFADQLRAAVTELQDLLSN